MYAGYQFSAINSASYDAKKGFEFFLRGAQLGDSACAFSAGSDFLFGIGTATNVEDGLGWVQKSAEAGYGLAQSSLAEWYYTGSVLPKNLTNAIHYYQLRAEAGDQHYQFQLGCIHATETKKFAEAVKWYRKAAEQGNAQAQVKLGLCYFKGEGVAKLPKKPMRPHKFASASAMPKVSVSSKTAMKP